MILSPPAVYFLSTFRLHMSRIPRKLCPHFAEITSDQHKKSKQPDNKQYAVEVR